jgi:hypothetical protein
VFEIGLIAALLVHADLRHHGGVDRQAEGATALDAKIPGGPLADKWDRT